MQHTIPYMFEPAFGLDLSTGFIIDDYGNVSYSYSDSVNYRNILSSLMIYMRKVLSRKTMKNARGIL